MQWISAKESLPPAKDGWNHSRRVAVYYKGNEQRLGAYGIAFYNYDPPYSEPGFCDFAHYGRQPDYWMPLPDAPR